MPEVQEVYNILISRGYQRELFASIEGQRREGKEMVGRCPFCSDSTGHFSYSLEKPVWRCWKCGRAGDWLQFIEATRGMGFKEALLHLAQKAGVEAESLRFDKAKYEAAAKQADILEAAMMIFAGDLKAPEGKPVAEYLAARGYAPEEWGSMGLGCYISRDKLKRELEKKGYAEKEMSEAGLFTDGPLVTGQAKDGPRGLGITHTLVFLWRDPSGRALGLVGRPPLSDAELKGKGLPKYLYSAGLRKAEGLLGFEAVRGAKQLILVEGVLDALYLNAKGFKAVACGGTSLSAQQIRAMEITGTQELFLALDMDEAGREATERVIGSLRTSRLRAYVVSLPEGFKDPDELLRGRGEDGRRALEKAILQAEGWPRWLAKYLVGRQDTSTEVGRDRALASALEALEGIQDGMDARAFQDSLQKAMGLSEEDLALKLAHLRKKASRQAMAATLKGTLRRLQQMVEEGDFTAAEQELTEGLRGIREARGIQVPEVYTMEAFLEDIQKQAPGLRTGYRDLDELITVPAGGLTIVAGRPGHGKTTFLLNLLLNMAEEDAGKGYFFFSYEEARHRLALKTLMIISGEVLHEKSNQGAYANYLKEKRGTHAKLERAVQIQEKLMASGTLWLSDRSLPAEDLATLLGHIGRRREIGAVFVDYIQRVPVRQPGEGPRYLELKRVSELLLEQAKGLDVPIVMGCQLGRGEKSQSGRSKVRLDNLREAGDIEQDAALVLGIYNEAAERQEEGGQEEIGRVVDLEVHVLKQRAGETGGKATLAFDRPVLVIKDKPVGAWK